LYTQLIHTLNASITISYSSYGIIAGMRGGTIRSCPIE
jgi:hypothetical protein